MRSAPHAHPGRIATAGAGAPVLRLLYLTRVYPYRPLFGGDLAYSSGIIESLGKACDLTVLAATNGVARSGRFDEGGIHWQLVPGSRRPQQLSVLTRMPNVMWRNATRAYRKALAALLAQDWDGIVVDHFASAHVLPHVVRWRRRHPAGCLLYLSHEHERTARAEKYASYRGGALRLAAMRLDGWKIGRWEDRLLAAMDVVSLINPRERHLFEERTGGRTFLTTLPGYDGPRRRARRITAATPRRVALLGGRGPVHKRNILRDWLDACAQPFSAADIELDVIGDIDPRLRAQLSSRFPAARFSGFVEDLGTHLGGCRLGVVPDTVGRGVKVRLPSYIFNRVPMAGVAGAIDGLPLAPGRDFAEAPDLAGLVGLCIEMVDDLPRLNALQNHAFAACDGLFDWASRGRDIVEAIRSVGRRGDASAPAPVGARPWPRRARAGAHPAP